MQPELTKKGFQVQEGLNPMRVLLLDIGDHCFINIFFYNAEDLRITPFAC